MTPGIKTTEFWTTVATWLVMILKLTGIVKVEDASGVESAAVSIVLGVASLISSALYIWSRLQLKKTRIDKGIIE